MRYFHGRCPGQWEGGGGGLPHEKDEDACLEMWISNSGLWMESRHYFLPIQLLPKTSHAPSYCVEYSTMKITVDLLFRCLFYSSANFWATSKLACNADLIQPWLITSAKKRQNPCSRHPTGSTNYQKCVLSFLPTWLANIDNGFLKRQPCCILKSWYTAGGQEKGILALACRQTYPEFKFCLCGRLHPDGSPLD